MPRPSTPNSLRSRAHALADAQGISFHAALKRLQRGSAPSVDIAPPPPPGNVHITPENVHETLPDVHITPGNVHITPQEDVAVTPAPLPLIPPAKLRKVVEQDSSSDWHKAGKLLPRR